jgi:hypothetical protein
VREKIPLELTVEEKAKSTGDKREKKRKQIFLCLAMQTGL